MSDADVTQRQGSPARPRRRNAHATLAQVDAIFKEGDRFGRFFVLERLGSGGMGVVIAAYDPDLDRRVAIKVLRPDGVLARSELREQMIREAQAMARLSHPNVVAVHEVGTVERVFFLVMELVEGGTLADWIASPRPWREVVAALCAAGRGLAAAHAHGLVHRDFKPHNVLVGKDGRVRVTDFGVVGVAGTTDEIAAGTPAYMAPEQHVPVPIDARTDQFAFCATLFEALYGRPPFAGATPEELQLAACAGPPPPPSGRDARGVPAWIYATIARGLSAEPAARFANMTELVDRLERDPRRATRRVAIGGAVLGLATVAVLGWSRVPGSGPAAIDPCDRAPVDASIEAAWGPAQRDGIATAFQAVRPEIARETFERVAGKLDRYAAGWRAERARVCATREDGAARGHDTALACLDRRRDQLAALTRVLARADAVIVPNAVAAVSNLEPPQGCAGTPPAAVMASATTGHHARLDRARSLLGAGLAADAAELAQAVLDAGPPAELEAHAALVLGRARRDLDDGEAAEAALLRAIARGSHAGLDDVVARAYADLAWVVSYFAGRPADALAIRPFVEAAIARAGSPAHVRAFAEFAAGSALVELARYPEAMVHLERAAEIWRRELDPEHPELARTLLTIGNVQSYQGDGAAAEATYREVIRLREASLGPHHPSLVGPLGNLGGRLLERGRGDEALALCERGLALVDQSSPRTPGARGHLLRCIGRAHFHLGRLDDAEAALDRAAELAAGAPNAWLGYVLANLGELANRRGELARAHEPCDRALATFMAMNPQDHPDNSYPLACRAAPTSSSATSPPRAPISSSRSTSAPCSAPRSSAASCASRSPARTPRSASSPAAPPSSRAPRRPTSTRPASPSAPPPPPRGSPRASAPARRSSGSAARERRDDPGALRRRIGRGERVGLELLPARTGGAVALRASQASRRAWARGS